VGGIDETYFKEMILVLMDLSSGYIFLEEASEDKSYETWLDKVKKVADRFNVEFKYFVSDRAKQLIKLATQGFNSQVFQICFMQVMSLSNYLESI